eukprot:CAMPEP_0181206720 /NCGR_PEP_ID=MMETSP1096-20121128/21188_1 /TAXON_ID=156174 ORGANISM="Chrysochromulina ericina, Strain CCMP281" /NCGR_SAMPLE_ID=MMETSP1096 /ASSEMBLY_ACC=CAM_ASM_000453 /LENGTH=172 /DNA_ID=CAMNT_0023297643 /DNA_START=693 /DNA_END=1211 /DNA_ORIENTATION=-
MAGAGACGVHPSYTVYLQWPGWRVDLLEALGERHGFGVADEAARRLVVQRHELCQVLHLLKEWGLLDRSVRLMLVQRRQREHSAREQREEEHVVHVRHVLIHDAGVAKINNEIGAKKIGRRMLQVAMGLPSRATRESAARAGAAHAGSQYKLSVCHAPPPERHCLQHTAYRN